MKNKHTFAIFYTTILILATIWSLLDTFVIADKIAFVDEASANTSIYADLENESSNSNTDIALDEYASSSNSDSTSGGGSVSISEDPVITNYSYQDSNIQITIEIIREYNTDIYIADVVVSDVAYLKTALANNTYGRNIKETNLWSKH